jgi:hypothetical protein
MLWQGTMRGKTEEFTEGLNSSAVCAAHFNFHVCFLVAGGARCDSELFMPVWYCGEWSSLFVEVGFYPPF